MVPVESSRTCESPSFRSKILRNVLSLDGFFFFCKTKINDIKETWLLNEICSKILTSFEIDYYHTLQFNAIIRPGNDLKYE